VSVDVEAAARAVMAHVWPFVAPEDAPADVWHDCRTIAEAVLALVAEEQTDLHADTDTIRDRARRGYRLSLSQIVGLCDEVDRLRAEQTDLHAVVDAALGALTEIAAKECSLWADECRAGAMDRHDWCAACIAVFALDRIGATDG
jgi:hypothetical protein